MEERLITVGAPFGPPRLVLERYVPEPEPSIQLPDLALQGDLPELIFPSRRGFLEYPDTPHPSVLFSSPRSIRQSPLVSHSPLRPRDFLSILVQMSYDPIELNEAASFIPEKCKVEGDIGNCSICLEKMNVGQEIIPLPCKTVNHVFHAECITKWLEGHNTCPMCRERI